MAEERMQRRVDEEGTLARLKILRDEIIDTAIADAHGRIIKTNGRRLPDWVPELRRCRPLCLQRWDGDSQA